MPNIRPKYEEPIETYWSSIQVPDKGYEWDEAAIPDTYFGRGGPPDPPYLVIHPEATMGVRSDPLEEIPALYETFATLNPILDEILRFANVYGWLGIGEYCHHTAPLSKMFFAESLSLWRDEIQEAALACWLLHRIVEVYLATGENKSHEQLSEDRRDLSRAIEWTDHNVFLAPEARRSGAGSKWRESQPRSRILIAGEPRRRESFEGWVAAGKNPMQPARHALLDLINAKLRSRAAPRLFFDARGNYQGRVVPDNLVTLIWLQMYRVLARQTKVRQCTICGKWMDVTDCRSTKRMHDRCSKAERMRKFIATRGKKNMKGKK